MVEYKASPTNMHASNTAAASESEELRLLLSKAADVFSEYVAGCQREETPIVAVGMQEASQLATEFAAKITTTGTDEDQIWDEIRRVCVLATNTWSDRFLYKLYAAPTPIGVVGETLMGVLNNNAHVFNASPVGVVLEAVVAQRLAAMANFPRETAGGLTFPGGSYSNIHALMVARNRRFPEIKTKGIGALGGKRPVVFTSQHAHYSIEKAAVAAGVGLDNVVHVPVDGRGRMDAAALRRLVEQEKETDGVPFFVNATAGTTVLGAFDPLDAIADVCEDHGLWLHVDGSWGGPLALFADRSVFAYDMPHARIHSFTVNPHKLLGIPLQCSVLLVRDGLRVMKDALGLCASYLFHSEDEEETGSVWLDRVGGSWDVGDATMGCGRRPDAIKLWITWRYYGTRYFSSRVNRARSAALAFTQLLRTKNESASHGLWLLVAAPESTCVCFWFVPRSLCNTTSANFEEMRQRALREPGNGIFGQEHDQRWGHATKAMFGRMGDASKVLVDYAQLHSVPAFFRLPFNSPSITDQTMANVLDSIESAALDLY
ncbi:Glutamate decarboxylase 2 [Coemansia sp. RSA 1813]|nr:Glutamate decarboxylase 2 [Coemansia sp. RSA 1646]KAJ1769057.1 Glutamate decarboxylase 2 [Coemansia sp. RSA 1843]KAJ2086880.1 Glutamate decarboxylase 2 [Coemansia sp. RSA 986]KAJ2211682.1 Glutamate decarboxylase 2 [Coemansia sp. RSA 487]KAJ2565364.1 Glutamate decarboxylase 2 [Coemansia sp. RSA 1813]